MIDRDRLRAFIETTQRSMALLREMRAAGTIEMAYHHSEAAFLAERIAGYLESLYEISGKKTGGYQDKGVGEIVDPGASQSEISEVKPRPAPQMPKGAETTTRG
jgi:hypothetical protein